MSEHPEPRPARDSSERAAAQLAERARQREREEGRRNLIRTLGFTLLGLGLLGMLVSVLDVVLAVIVDVGDGDVHYAWLLFVGLAVLVLGRLVLLSAGRPVQRLSIDCAHCGAINDAESLTCRTCRAPID